MSLRLPSKDAYTAFARFYREMPHPNHWDVIRCKEYDRIRAAHGRAAGLSAYIKTEGWPNLTVYIDSETGKLVVATVRMPILTQGEQSLCYHARFREETP